jgi:hypothetical protein
MRCILPRLVPKTRGFVAAGSEDTGACGLYGIGGWQLAWLPLFSRTVRVYVALDRDASEPTIALARTFGTRGRVLILPEDFGLKGRSQRLAAGGREGGSCRVSVAAGAGTRDEPDALGAPDPAVATRLGALGSRGPCRRARPPVRAGPSRTARPRCAPVPCDGAVRGLAHDPTGGGPRACAERGDRVVGALGAHLLLSSPPRAAPKNSLMYDFVKAIAHLMVVAPNRDSNHGHYHWPQDAIAERTVRTKPRVM